MDKVLLLDKPAGWTSFDVVAKIRGKLRAENPGQKIKVGHAGTLDPFATGLLIVLTGVETKNQDHYMKQDKEYSATLKLGYTSSTGDTEGEITKIPKSKYQIPNEIQIEECLKEFIGQTEQSPPIYSAIKINGQRAYKLARQGKEVTLKSRTISIKKLRLMNYDWPELRIRVKCSSGTYIRTLGEDIGKALGCGAYLIALRRNSIGEYNVDNSIKIEDVFKDITERTINESNV